MITMATKSPDRKAKKRAAGLYADEDPDDLLEEIREVVALQLGGDQTLAEALSESDLRSIVQEHVHLSDVKAVMSRIVVDALRGKPTALKLFIQITGLGKAGEERPEETEAERLTKVVKDALSSPSGSVFLREIEIRPGDVPGDVYKRLLSGSPDPAE
jgi:hypothetical protein